MSSLPNTQSVDTNIITNNSETFNGEVNPELIDNIIDKTRGFNSKQEIKRHIIDNYGRKSYNIFADYIKALDDYSNDINEIKANDFGNEIKEKLKGVDYERLYAETMGYAQKVREEWNVRTGYENSSTINKEKNPTGRERGQARMDKGTLSKLQRELTVAQRGIAFGKEFINEERNDIRGIQETGRQLSSIDGEWNNGTNARGSVRQRRGYSDGDYSIEQPEYKTEPTKEEINKATTVKNSDKIPQVVAKKEVRKWYGGIQKDRYDVNKNLTSFVKFSTYILQDTGM